MNGAQELNGLMLPPVKKEKKKKDIQNIQDDKFLRVFENVSVLHIQVLVYSARKHSRCFNKI